MIEVNVDEVKLNTIANFSTFVDEIEISPLTLREIIKLKYNKYNQLLSMVSVRKEDLITKESLAEIPSEFSVCDIIVRLNDDALTKLFFDSLRVFLKTEDIRYDNDYGLIINNEQVNLDSIVKIIKIQNCIVTPDEDIFNPLNERAKRIKEKMLANKKKIQELNSLSDNEESLNFLDLISILCSNANGINLFNVFELNMFQFSDQFNRMRLIDDYEINIQALLHGADSKGIQLKHWISKMK